MPKIIEFYEKYKKDDAVKDKFEIISVHNKSDLASDWKTLDKTKKDRGIVEKRWNGKDMTWPEMLDGEGKTVETYGVPGFPGLVIIDPEGNVHQAAHFIFPDFKKIIDDVKAGKEIERKKPAGEKKADEKKEEGDKGMN